MPSRRCLPLATRCVPVLLSSGRQCSRVFQRLGIGCAGDLFFILFKRSRVRQAVKRRSLSGPVVAIVLIKRSCAFAFCKHAGKSIVHSGLSESRQLLVKNQRHDPLLRLEAGVDLLTISKLLGHASFTTTMIYLHCRREHLINVPSPLDWLPVRQLPTYRPPEENNSKENDPNTPKS